MFRKFILAIAATAALSTAALAPTSASAWGGHHGHHGWYGGYGIGIGFAPAYVAAPDCYRVKRQVVLADGSIGWRRFTVCN
jgi:hypothetical protein